MKEKVNQLFKDKLLLVMVVLGLLTIVAAAGAVRIQRGSLPNETNPYLDMEDPGGLAAGEDGVQNQFDGDQGREIIEERPSVAGASDGARENGALAENEGAEGHGAGGDGERAAAAGAGQSAASALVLNFGDASRMAWPVEGNVILDYSMDSTIYFPTLDQYKCNSALVIQSDVSTPVKAPANARVLEVGANEEIGNYVTLDLGNEYAAVCGQLKEVDVLAGEYVERGALLGYVAEPTKYYSVEGNNLYLKLTKNGQPVDALDFLE